MEDDKFNLDIPRIGYFIVYKGDNSFMSKQIKNEQKQSGFDAVDSEYTHVEVSGGGQWSVGAVMPKSKIMNIIDAHGGRHIKIMKYTGYEEEGMDNNKRYKVGFFAASEANLPYGWWTLIWFKLRDFFHKLKPWGRKKAPFCSLLAAWGLTMVFPEAFEDYRTVMPAHFLTSAEFKCVWEGDLPTSLQSIANDTKEDEDK